jgi:hypothetical protein
MRRIRSHLTYANVIATLALFLALGGGTAVALTGSNTVFSDDIVDHQVKSPDLAGLGFTPVKPNPRTTVDPCQSNQTGVFCGGEGSHPAYWTNLGNGYASAAYARDGLGIVHLQGTMITTATTPTSFVLPSGYRPAAKREFAVAYGQSNTCGGSGCDERLTVVQIRPNGAVEPLGNQPGAGSNFSEGVSLDGVEFRCGASGQNGCP